MSEKHLSRKPFHLRQHSNHRVKHMEMWYYEESGGLLVVTKHGGLMGLIPWLNVRAALRRKLKGER